MKGVLYGVGVGPGEPELLTLKAARVMREADIIAMPCSKEDESLAFEIARQAVSEISQKPRLLIEMPMTRDESVMEKSHAKAAAEIVQQLNEGKNIAFLTLGDPTIYSTYLYIHKKVNELGGKTCIIPGIPSFCAAAAALNTGLVEREQVLHIIPASYEGTDSGLDMAGTKVLMKTGKSFLNVKGEIEKRGLLPGSQMVQKCGMKDQKIYQNLADTDEKAGYFSIILVKDVEK